MSIRDSWHSALVYFGLAEEYQDDYDDRPRRTSRTATASARTCAACAAARDEFDDIFADEDQGEAGGRTAPADDAS